MISWLKGTAVKMEDRRETNYKLESMEFDDDMG